MVEMAGLRPSQSRHASNKCSPSMCSHVLSALFRMCHRVNSWRRQWRQGQSSSLRRFRLEELQTASEVSNLLHRHGSPGHGPHLHDGDVAGSESIQRLILTRWWQRVRLLVSRYHVSLRDVNLGALRQEHVLSCFCRIFPYERQCVV